MSSSLQTDTASTQLSTKSGGDGSEKSLETAKSGELRQEMAKTWGHMFRIWPYRSFLIVLMEFSFMLTALNNVFNLYFINVLGYDPDSTVIILNINGILSGCCKLLGSAFSDSYLGKFKGLLYGSCIYILGKLIITGATFFPPGLPHPWLDFLAVLIIMIGTSSMSPNISPFGADQFEPHQEKMISVYYSIFYASINIGAMVSNTMMPVLRARPCFGKDSCYPLSFTVSTLGVIVAFVFFIVGSKWYIIKPPSGNIFSAVKDVVKTALANRKKSTERKKEHWLDYYFDTHTCETDRKCLELRKKEGDPQLCQKERFIEDFHSLLRMLVVFIPLPMFWALYDQQYTVWMNQALLLDSRIWGNFRLLPDQMQVVNPVLIIVLIFAFQSCIYPFFERLVRLTPLRKMVAGGFIAALAFLVSGFVQLMINPTLPNIPPEGRAFVSVVNTFPGSNCTLKIIHVESGKDRLLLANMSLVEDKLIGRDELFLVDLGQNTWNFKWNESGKECPKLPEKPVKLHIKERMSLIVLGPTGIFLTWADTRKPTGGTAQFKIAVLLALNSTRDDDRNLAFCRRGHGCDQHAGKDFYAFFDKSGKPAHEKVPDVGGGSAMATLYPYIEVRQGSWDLNFLLNDHEHLMREKLNVKPIEGIHFDTEDQGGIYTLVVTGSEEEPVQTLHQVVPPNSVNILWQLPQIFIISVAEILVSITGLEFAFSQSGLSMKSIANACWGMTVSLGSIIIIVITLLPIENLAYKAFFCAGAMLVDVLIFALLANFKFEYRKGTLAAIESETRLDEKSLKSRKYSTRSTASSGIEKVPKSSYIHEGGAEQGGIQS